MLIVLFACGISFFMSAGDYFHCFFFHKSFLFFSQHTVVISLHTMFPISLKFTRNRDMKYWTVAK
jgi:hypothetical protein